MYDYDFNGKDEAYVNEGLLLPAILSLLGLGLEREGDHIGMACMLKLGDKRRVHLEMGANIYMLIYRAGCRYLPFHIFEQTKINQNHRNIDHICEPKRERREDR